MYGFIIIDIQGYALEQQIRENQSANQSVNEIWENETTGGNHSSFRVTIDHC